MKCIAVLVMSEYLMPLEARHISWVVSVAKQICLVNMSTVYQVWYLLLIDINFIFDAFFFVQTFRVSRPVKKKKKRKKV